MKAARPPEGPGPPAPLLAVTAGGPFRQAATAHTRTLSAPRLFGGTWGRGYLAAPLLALGVVLLPALRQAHAAPPPTLLAKVEQVSDGASLIARAETGTPLRIQLLGIAAPLPHGPRPGQPFGEAARDYLTRLIGGRTVRLVSYSREGSDRLLAVVFLGPTNVNVAMIAQGLAKLDWGVACPAYCRDLKLAERKARRDRVGLWGQGASGESLAAFRGRGGLQGE